MDINTNTDVRPQISENVLVNKLSNQEIDIIYNNYYEKEKKDKKKNIMDQSINEIIHNTIYFLDHFQEDYQNKIYELELNKDYDYKNKSSINIYLTAFGLHVRDNDNIIYFGIILIIISILIYFFSISK